MILTPEISDIIANQNTCYKCNDLELKFFQQYTDSKALILSCMYTS